jgi:hypothetical protein
MIFEALGLFGLGNPCVTCDSSSLMISKALGLSRLANPCVTRDSTSLMISEALGLLGFRIHGSPLTAVR